MKEKVHHQILASLNLQNQKGKLISCQRNFNTMCSKNPSLSTHYNLKANTLSPHYVIFFSLILIQSSPRKFY